MGDWNLTYNSPYRSSSCPYSLYIQPCKAKKQTKKQFTAKNCWCCRSSRCLFVTAKELSKAVWGQIVSVIAEKKLCQHQIARKLKKKKISNGAVQHRLGRCSQTSHFFFFFKSRVRAGTFLKTSNGCQTQSQEDWRTNCVHVNLLNGIWPRFAL